MNRWCWTVCQKRDCWTTPDAGLAQGNAARFDTACFRPGLTHTGCLLCIFPHAPKSLIKRLGSNCGYQGNAHNLIVPSNQRHLVFICDLSDANHEI